MKSNKRTLKPLSQRPLQTLQTCLSGKTTGVSYFVKSKIIYKCLTKDELWQVLIFYQEKWNIWTVYLMKSWCECVPCVRKQVEERLRLDGSQGLSVTIISSIHIWLGLSSELSDSLSPLHSSVVGHSWQFWEIIPCRSPGNQSVTILTLPRTIITSCLVSLNRV